MLSRVVGLFGGEATTCEVGDSSFVFLLAL
jgi:hypothetical protein